MPARRLRDENAVSLRFGGGINSRFSEEDIEDAECAAGINFDLVAGDSTFKPRKPFDFIGQVPNEAEVRGMGTLLKTDGTVQFFVQGGNKVYEWDGGSGTSAFTEIATVSASARLRGRLEHNWQIEDKLIVTDIALAEGVHEWNGSVFEAVTFLKNDGSSTFGLFRAKYCQVDNERALFANVQDASGVLGHLMVGSRRGNFAIISNEDRPSSSLSDEDAFFLVHPENRAINGITSAFGTVAISGSQGSMYKLEGGSAQDFSLDPLYPRSGASGDESMVFIGNDIAYGRAGSIESLMRTEKFGDVEEADLSLKIAPDIEDFGNWTLVYNSRNKRLYCFPSNASEVWVMHKTLLETGLSPWSKWTTTQSMAFQPTTVLNGIDPADGLEYVFMGDANGNFYRMEGTGSGDGASADVRATRTSKMFVIPMDAKMQGGVEAYAKYRRLENENNLVVTFEFAGESINDRSKALSLTAGEIGAVYGGSSVYGGSARYGTLFLGRLARRTFQAPGGSNEFQISTTVEGQSTFAIAEIGCRFTSAS